jgi:nucleotide-binding universal stress UspA family protein
MESLEAEGDRAVEDVASRCAAADVETETAVVVGTVHRAIEKHIEDNDIDLVVMGTHGRKGIERFLLGSVTERTVRTSPVPVLTVSIEDDGDEATDAAGTE